MVSILKQPNQSADTANIANKLIKLMLALEEQYEQYEANWPVTHIITRFHLTIVLKLSPLKLG